MDTLLEAQSTLTDRYQTTVPESVRRILGLGKRDKLNYTVRETGEVVLTRVAPEAEDDPILGDFLTFLARDIATHPDRLQALDGEWLRHLQALTVDVPFDLDAALNPEDE